MRLKIQRVSMSNRIKTPIDSIEINVRPSNLTRAVLMIRLICI